MPKIIQLSPHVANLIAAGEVVERPASVVKELLENSVDAGATQITLEIRDGGMTFLRVTDNGCGMTPEDARTAFLRHATSKLKSADDLAAIVTMGFRGEALAAIASVSRIDLLTKTPGAVSGTSLSLEAGVISEESEAGCPDGTTIIIRDLFFNTPARMKFMKSDTVESGKIAAAVQQQALAHPNVAYRFLRDGKEVLSTPGSGSLEAAVYCVYGRECGKLIPLDSKWDCYTLSGFVSKPTDARATRTLQTFFVNGRPVKSRILVAALEEAYRNQIMVGKFPACVLHLTTPANAVDVNVHPAKTEVKFLNEKDVFDCIHYGVLGALNKTPDRPQVQFRQPSAPAAPPVPAVPRAPELPPKQENFFRTMSTREYKQFTSAIKDAPKPSPLAAAATAMAVEETVLPPIREEIILPSAAPVRETPVQPEAAIQPPAPESVQTQIETMPQEIPWRYVGELYNSYIIAEQGEEAYLIDKHAAHERILFEKLKANQEAVSAQTLLIPIAHRTSPDAAAILLDNRPLLEELGFEIQEFGENTILARQIPMDLDSSQAESALEMLAKDLLNGRRERKENIRDELLHTIACKAAIKAGWESSREELEVLISQVLSRDDLKHCPHGRPICITLSKKQLEKQFKRS